MRVVITVDPNIPVPPRQYGGIERVVDFVVRGFVARGHQVTLIAHPDSHTPATLVPYGVPPHKGFSARATELRQVGAWLLRHRKQFDVILSWGRLAALIPVLPLRGIPKIQRYCRDGVPWRSVAIATRLAGDSIRFAGASASVYDSPPGGKPCGRWVTVFDGIEIEKYDFVPSVAGDAPLGFLGRLEPYKGAHTAIAIAKAAGRRLLIAATAPNREYFETKIRPHIDGDRVQYLGPVDDRGKNAMLGQCAALLNPISCKEAFGLVMAEAFACGTPVIAYRAGSTPEIVKPGANGFLATDMREAVTQVHRLSEIDRAAARADCEARFSSTVVIENFEHLCQEMYDRIPQREKRAVAIRGSH